jgi:hypothetical protein
MKDRVACEREEDSGVGVEGFGDRHANLKCPGREVLADPRGGRGVSGHFQAASLRRSPQVLLEPRCVFTPGHPFPAEGRDAVAAPRIQGAKGVVHGPTLDLNT